MGLFDIFRPGKEKKPDPFSIWSGSTLPAPHKAEQGLTSPAKKQDPFAVFAPPPVPAKIHQPQPLAKEQDPFTIWSPGQPRSRTLEEAMVPESERGSLYHQGRQEPRRREEYSPPKVRPPIVQQSPQKARDPYDPEAFATHLPKMFYLDSIFDEVRGIRSTASWRRAVEDSAHTGEPAEVNLGEVEFEKIFGVSEADAEFHQTEELLLGMLTAAFEIVKPEEFSGWFQLKWVDIGSPGRELAYREVKQRPNMGGLFDFFKKKKPAQEERGLIPSGPTLPVKAKKKDPFAMWAPGPEGSEERAAPQEQKKDPFAIWQPEPSAQRAPASPTAQRDPAAQEADAFSIWQPEPTAAAPAGARRPPAPLVPAEADPFAVWSPEAQAFEAERMRQAPLFEVMVPESERGSLYKTEKDPFQVYAPPPSRPAAPGAPYEAPRQYETRRETFRSESPSEVVRQGKKYYVPLTPKEVADRMIEVYGEDGIRNIYSAIMEDRKDSEWELNYYRYAFDRDNGHEENPPSIILEHMSLHDDGGAYVSEAEIMSEMFNIPMDYLESFLGSSDPDSDEYMEGYEELNQEVFWPLYTEIVPQAWALIYPGLPGDIILSSSEDDGCPEMQYVEVPPEDVHPTMEFIERLEENLDSIQLTEAKESDLNREERQRLRDWERSFGSGGEESEEDLDVEEGDEEAEEEEEEPEEEEAPPPPPKKKKGKKK